MEITLLFVLFLLNGLFSMSEIALVTSRRSRLQQLEEQGDHGAAAALRLAEHPTRFMSTIQIGITSIGIMSGIFGESALAEPLSQELQTHGLSAATSSSVATALVVILITYVSIVLGELVPKRLGQLHPETVSRRVARPLEWLALLSTPFVRLLSTTTEMLLRLLGVRERMAAPVTPEEIQAMVAESTEAGTIEEEEHELVRNVFRLDERSIASLMVPRGDIVALDVEDLPKDLLAFVEATPFHAMPVYRGGPDDVIGILESRWILSAFCRGESPDLAALCTPALFVPETTTALDMLERFRETGARMALVVDEYGDLQGLVSLHDMLEAIAGEFNNEEDEDMAFRREDGSWLLDGLTPSPELRDHLELTTLPDGGKAGYETLAGMLMFLLGRMPSTGDIARWQDWTFEIVDMDGKRIDKVLAVYSPEEVRE